MADFDSWRGLLADLEALMRHHADLAGIRLGPDKWTLKEMVAHLIDSASNNHQRFMRLQLEERISIPAYDAEQWLAVSGVERLDYLFAVDFWVMYNRFLLNLMEGFKPEHLHRVWIRPDGSAKTLGFLREDYFSHLQVHRELFEKRAAEILASRV